MTGTSVLVVGAGPTGLTLAVELARRNVPVTLIDRQPEYFAGSRGKGLQPRTLEVFDDLGVADETLRWASVGLITRHHRHGQSPIDSDPAEGMTGGPDVPYPVPVGIPQFRVERILRDRLADFGGSVRLGTELVEFRQTPDRVTALLRGQDGVESWVDADYLVGCDGGRSTVRKALDVRFEGNTAEAPGMIIADLEVTGLEPDDRWHIWTSERGVFALCPFEGERVWQAQAAATQDGQPRLPEPSLDAFRQVFADVAGETGVQLTNPTWMSTYRVNVRMVDRMRVGRVFLAGDAAHVHSPAGGLGMNTGIQDAYNLGWKLAMVLAGTADPDLLDSYDEERLPVAVWTLGTSDERLRQMAEEFAAGRNGMGFAKGGGPTRQLEIGYPAARRSVQLVDRGDAPGAGDRAPDAPCVDPDGTPVRLFDVFRGQDFVLLGFGADTAPALRAVADLPWLRTCLVLPEPAEAEGVDRVLIDRDGHAARAYRPGTAGGRLVLVRPDGHLGLVGTPDDHGAVRGYLAPVSRTSAPPVHALPADPRGSST